MESIILRREDGGVRGIRELLQFVRCVEGTLKSSDVEVVCSSGKVRRRNQQRVNDLDYSAIEHEILEIVSNPIQMPV